MATLKIKKGDMVKVIAGKDKDKEGCRDRYGKCSYMYGEDSVFFL